MRRPSAKWLWLIPPFLFGTAHLDQVEGFVGGSDARRAPVGLAPNPKTTAEPVVQVYAARTVRWRGYFGVHTWVSVKPRGAAEFTTYEVNGWRLRRTGRAVSVDHRSPDARWFGNRPELLADLRGEGVDAVITRIEAAVAAYPYPSTYRVWPGPNSNTFVAHVLRAAPELRADLPAHAIGKDYLGPAFVARSPSGTGAQVNLYGVVGALAGVEEGVELNVLGLTFGVDPLDLSLKLPMAGRLGWLRETPAPVTIVPTTMVKGK
ncbi:MAG TPA: DUF3750 domain-containing protein [Gammaproteobacteria bacterium]